MDKVALIREITIRLMDGDVDAFKSKQVKSMWYAKFIAVAEVINKLEELSELGIVDFNLKKK